MSEIPERIDGDDLVLRTATPTLVGNALPFVVSVVALGGLGIAYSVPYWWAFPLAIVVGLLVRGIRREVGYSLRIGPEALETSSIEAKWTRFLRPRTQPMAWHDVAAVEVVAPWWGRQVRLAHPPVIRSPLELRSWRWLPDRSFDDRVALIRRTWLEAGPMPGPPPPASLPPEDTLGRASG